MVEPFRQEPIPFSTFSLRGRMLVVLSKHGLQWFGSLCTSCAKGFLYYVRHRVPAISAGMRESSTYLVHQVFPTLYSTLKGF